MASSKEPSADEKDRGLPRSFCFVVMAAAPTSEPLADRITRLTWTATGTMRIDGFGYPVTLLMADSEKA
jgi:hypothetical protein